MQLAMVEDSFQERQLLIYLPERYMESEERYPVVYLQDSGDLIAPEDSDVLQEVRHLAARKELKHFIFVGIASFDRNDEYTPFHVPSIFNPGKMFGGSAAAYASFVATELKPYIDGKYRTLPDKENTGVMGFSLGGLISFHTGLLYPDIFGRIGSFSGSFWFPGFVEWVKKNPVFDEGQRLYMNVGDGEGKGRTNGQQWMVPNTKELYEYVLQNGLSEQTARLDIYESDRHCFECGVIYVPEALQWLFNHERL